MRRPALLLASLALLFCQRETRVASAPLPANAAAVPSFADVAARTLPGVVAISTQRRVTGRVHPFLPPQEGVVRGSGSGFVISSDGYIVTNHHVVERATDVEVHTSDEKTLSARVVGRDPETDIALLKVDGARGLPALTLGDSDAVRPGDWAIAVGNPLQFANSVTVGVVSAHGRSLGLSEATAAFEDFMQTDAAINPGNSGGPLLNARGEVIGINTAMRAAAQNIGFATPVRTLKRILDPLKRDGRVRRGYLGITVTEIDDRFQAAFKLRTPDGVLIQSVEPESPAARAGLKRGDVLLEANGSPTNSSRSMIEAIAYAGPDARITMRVLRDGREQEIRATTSERPGVVEMTPLSEPDAQPASDKIGIAAAPLSAAIRQRLGLPGVQGGVVVAAVTPASPADEAGLAVGDVIVEVDGRAVDDTDQLRDAISRGRGYLRIYVMRAAGPRASDSFYAVVRVSS